MADITIALQLLPADPLGQPFNASQAGAAAAWRNASLATLQV